MKTPKINEGFTCMQCKAEVPPHPTSCRNHCPECLFSQHVDGDAPGDRSIECFGKMYPKTVTQHPKKGLMVVHECILCGHEQKNKIAPDDNMDKVISLTQIPYVRTTVGS